MVDEYAGKKIVSPLDFKDELIVVIQNQISEQEKFTPIVCGDGTVLYSQDQIDATINSLKELESIVLKSS